ncbi:hypothetical protein BJ165DRAFT_1345282 [Panaeolus papilionaceus]|nr:hypothetical protein BJ165DRAFT_1345282 [Panaeolus papilionaceus]
MIRVTLDGHLLAESNETRVVEGNHYFPATSVRMSLLGHSDTSSVCSWKGTAAYYDAVVDGNRIKDIAW